MASTTYSAPGSTAQSTQRLVQSITTNIQKIAQSVSQIENMNTQVGTTKDSESLRDKLLQTENYTNQLAKDTNKQLKELNIVVRAGSADDTRHLKIQKERLTNDLFKSLNKFQEVQKASMQKQRESNERAKTNMNEPKQTGSGDDAIKMDTIGASAGGNLFDAPPHEIAEFDNSFDQKQQQEQQQQQQRQTQISMENDLTMTQLREREAALQKLEHDITDVNMIFKDLAVMVHYQGEVVDSIESNVESVQIRVNDANTHLESARKNQAKARKKKFILLSVLGGVILVFLLIVIMSIRWN
jgi:syntaxin 12/13